MSRVETIGECTLHLGDCREVIPTLSAVDAVVTDPPYGTQDLGGGYGRRQNWNKGDGLSRVIANDKDLSALESAWPLLVQVVPQGWLMVFYADRRTPDFCKATAALPWFGNVIWDKAVPGLGYHIRYAHESVAVFRAGEPPRPCRALISVLRGSAAAVIHPHEKPISVVCSLVGWCSMPGQVVLDPFMGSGTTAVACATLQRRFVGIEIDPTHFSTACRRVEAAYRQPRLFDEERPAGPSQTSLFGGEAA